MLHLLLKKGTDLSFTLKGSIWGKGYELETFVPAVNPLSYMVMGLLPQMHRDHLQIAENISLLIQYAYGTKFKLPNVPKEYLKD
jgi:hypothetical protein